MIAMNADHSLQSNSNYGLHSASHHYPVIILFFHLHGGSSLRRFHDDADIEPAAPHKTLLCYGLAFI